MLPDNKQFNGYSNGSEMWRDTASSYGIDEAVTICRSYLDLNLKREHADDERQFCREMFAAMYEATANNANAKKIVYPYTIQVARERTEDSHYRTSREMNRDCARLINQNIEDSHYKAQYYNLENVVWFVVLEYGFNRMNMVLAHHIQIHRNDGRYSYRNKEWAEGFTFPGKAFDDVFMNKHAVLVNDFTTYAHKLFESLGAERFALPGHEEQDEVNSGFEIKRAITVSDDGNGFSTGYAIGHNPQAVSPWVCWQFAVRDGERLYNWGVYCDDEQTAIDAYNARVFVAMN